MAETPVLEVQDLHVSVEGKPILKGVNLVIRRGEIHGLMGPNGSGKSTLSNTLMGHPKYEVTHGRILFEGEDVTALRADQRAKKGMFLAFQYPTAIPGVTVANFLRQAVKSVRGEEVQPRDFRKVLKETMKSLDMDESFATRYVNDGFSGGEKKRHEILQMALLKPKLAILDETDSGLDIDALRIVSEGINRLAGPELGILLITHYVRILNYVQPHFVHVFYQGQVVKSGGKEVAQMLEEKGYEGVISEFAGRAATSAATA